jgi:hypothetical protein
MQTRTNIVDIEKPVVGTGKTLDLLFYCFKRDRRRGKFHFTPLRRTSRR